MAVTYSGLLYRALNPVYASNPMSGRGAELYGGRFNPKGVPALYASTSVLTALREANQVGDLQHHPGQHQVGHRHADHVAALEFLDEAAHMSSPARQPGRRDPQSILPASSRSWGSSGL